jgi:hypothetical protein
MRLATIVASYPVFAFESRVTHQTPRRPTVFEQMVLRLIRQAESAESLAGNGLRELFEEMLGVADSHLLLNPTVHELIGLEVLRAPAVPDMIEAPLRAWGITEVGREFIQRGLLPGRPRYETLEYWYEPLADTLQLLREGEPRGSSAGATRPQPLHLDSAFPMVDLAPRVRASLPGERHRWFEAATEIMEVGVAALPEATRWREVELTLECGHDGRLDLQAPSDAAMARWLRQATPEDVWRRLVGPALGGALPDDGDAGQDSGLARQRLPEGLQSLRLETAAAISPWAPPPAARSAKAQSLPSGLLLRPTRTADAAVDQAGVGECLDVIEIGAHGPEGFNVADPGIGLRLPPFPGLPQALTSIRVMRPGAEPLVTVEGMVTMHWAGQPRQVALRMQLASATGDAVWRALLPLLDHALHTTKRLEHLPLALWFEPPAAVVDRWLAGAEECAPEAWFSALGEFVAALNRRWPGGEPLEEHIWTSRILPRASARLERLQAGLNLLRTLALIEATASVRHGRNSLVLMLLERTAPLGAVDDVLRMRQAVSKLPGLVFPASLLGDDLRLQLVKESMLDAESSVGAHALSTPLREFGQIFKRSRSAIKPVLMDPSRRLTADWVKAARSQPGSLIAAVETLDRAVEALCPALGNQDAPAVRYLQGMRACFQEIRDWMAGALGRPLSDGRRAVVLDTSSLMASPGLLAQMPDGDVPVIAKRVLEELDGLKSGRVGDGPEGELRARSARQAVAAIEAAGGRVIFEPSRRDQCARDWPATPDNEILSVAVFHALNDVVLVSADRNLRNKAQAETLRAMDTDQYLSAIGRVRSAPQPPKNQPRRQTTR